MEIACDLAAVGPHGYLSPPRLRVAKDQGVFRQAHRHGRDHREGADLFAKDAIHIAILHRARELKLDAGHLHAKMRRENRFIFGQSDLARIGDRIKRTILGLRQPIRLGVRLILGDRQARVIPAGLVVHQNGRSQVDRGSAFHAGQTDSREGHLAGQALDGGEVHSKRSSRTHRYLVGLGLKR
jgi:hypothetical protein